MVQIRVMTDDAELGEDVLAVLLPLLRSCTALRTGEPTRLGHRGGGLRAVLDVQLAGPPAVRVERVSQASPDRATAREGAVRSPRRRAALPPGG
ncbi:hypothetical protein [Streptomyces jumonjinensis]|uniref:hypothetical protein n=1 Tax=Streptomyces jumonjinensis TaxID=1945 RepID=UPI0037A7906C